MGHTILYYSEFLGIDNALRPINSYTLQVISTDFPNVKIILECPNIVVIASVAIAESMLLRASFFYFLDN